MSTKKKKFAVNWNDQLKKMKGQNSPGAKFKDERVYYPKLEKCSGSAIVRFLQSPNLSDMPFVKKYSHAFKGPGGWYIQFCPKTPNSDGSENNDKPCPVCEHNAKIWNDNEEEIARKLTHNTKRKTEYFSNILVVKDPATPENDNKVWIMKYGPKIFSKIWERLFPPEKSVLQPIKVFDYYEGADFRWIITPTKIGNKDVPSYDTSQFDNPSPLGSDDEIEAIHKQVISLEEFVSPEKILSYDQLLEKFKKVMGLSGGASVGGASVGAAVGQNAPTPKKETVIDEDAETENETENESDSASEESESMFSGNDEEFFDEIDS